MGLVPASGQAVPGWAPLGLVLSPPRLQTRLARPGLSLPSAPAGLMP